MAGPLYPPLEAGCPMTGVVSDPAAVCNPGRPWSSSQWEAVCWSYSSQLSNEPFLRGIWVAHLCVYLTADLWPVQFSCSVVSNSLWPHELQHARPTCPSPAPGVHSNSRPSSWWCHPAISSSVVPFSSCPQSLLASESFPMSQFFAWGGQSTWVSALASFFPQNTQD